MLIGFLKEQAKLLEEKKGTERHCATGGRGEKGAWGVTVPRAAPYARVTLCAMWRITTEVMRPNTMRLATAWDRPRRRR